MKNSHKVFVLALVAIALIGVGAYVYTQKKQTEQPKTEIVDCGKKYTADIVLIGGVNVVKRISELKLEIPPLENNPSIDKCDFSITGDKIAVAQKEGASKGLYEIVLYDKDSPQQVADPFNQSVNLFTISLNDNIVYFEDQFTGGLHNMGVWK